MNKLEYFKASKFYDLVTKINDYARANHLNIVSVTINDNCEAAVVFEQEYILEC